MPVFAFVCAAMLPLALWHHAIAAVAEDFRLEPGYLFMGWGLSLYVMGLALASQVAAAVG